MTLTLRRVPPKVRSMKLEWRMRWRCSAGNRRQAIRPGAPSEMISSGLAGPRPFLR